jgi:hypothetical protein
MSCFYSNRAVQVGRVCDLESANDSAYTSIAIANYLSVTRRPLSVDQLKSLVISVSTFVNSSMMKETVLRYKSLINARRTTYITEHRREFIPENLNAWTHEAHLYDNEGRRSIPEYMESPLSNADVTYLLTHNAIRIPYLRIVDKSLSDANFKNLQLEEERQAYIQQRAFLGYDICVETSVVNNDGNGMTCLMQSPNAYIINNQFRATPFCMPWLIDNQKRGGRICCVIPFSQEGGQVVLAAFETWSRPVSSGVMTVYDEERILIDALNETLPSQMPAPGSPIVGLKNCSLCDTVHSRFIHQDFE